MQSRRAGVGIVVVALFVSATIVPAPRVQGHAALTGQIAYETWDRDPPGAPAEIYVVDVDGTNRRNLTNHRSRDSGPSWSPDGRQIAFSSDRAAGQGIYIMEANGRLQRLLTDFGAGPLAWSPDGRRLAFVAYVDGNLDIYVIDAVVPERWERPAVPQRLTEDPARDSWPSWSPDGRQIAFESDRQEDKAQAGIYVMDADGGNPRNLTPVWSAHQPSWSPDGQQIAFASGRGGTMGIWVMDADGGNPRNLTDEWGGDEAPSWTSDGQHIIFQSYRDINYEVYVMEADGTDQRNLTRSPDQERWPSFFDVTRLGVSSVGMSRVTWGWIKESGLEQE